MFRQTASSMVCLSLLATAVAAGDESVAANVEIEVGTRAFTERPDHRGRAEFEKYGEIRQGLYLEGLQIDIVDEVANGFAHLTALDAFRDNQRLTIDAGRAGAAYVFGRWDEVPNVASRQATAQFDQTAPNRLEFTGPVRPIDIETQRRTGTLNVRLTPSANWDLRFEYINQTRKGRRALGTNQFFFDPVELVAPIDHKTENIAMSAQYTGHYNDRKTWMVRAEYRRSQFENRYDRLLWQLNNIETSNSLAPSNVAHQVMAAYSTALPLIDGRYAATVASGWTETSGSIVTDPGQTTDSEPSAKITTLSHNHVLSGRLSKTLTANARYAYRKVNDTRRLTVEELQDAGLVPRPDGDPIVRAPEHRRRTASGALKWRLARNATVGGKYQWEQIDRRQREVKKTQEHTVKLHIDARLESGQKVHVSYARSHRQFDNYIQLETDQSGHQQEPMRKFDIANRERDKLVGRFTIPVGEDEDMLITPTAGWRQDEFGDNLATGGTFGLKEETVWHLGVDVTWSPTEWLSLTSSYTREHRDRIMVNRSTEFLWNSQSTDVIHTVITTADIVVQEDVLNLRLSHVRAMPESETRTTAFTDAPHDPSRFPNSRSTFDRFMATLSYQFSGDVLGALGFEGEATANLSYVMEQNSLVSWQFDNLPPGISYLNAYDPNYRAHHVGLSVRAKW